MVRLRNRKESDLIVNSNVGLLQMFVEARIAGDILVAHSASCGFRARIHKIKLASERHNS